MSLKRMPFISAVQLARIDGSNVIPTALYYDERKPLVGREALGRCPSPELLVEDFKLDLGRSDPDAQVHRPGLRDATPRRTPVGLLKDFLEETLKKITQWLDVQGLAVPTRILIAEPLSLGGNSVADEAWLSYYRKAIRKVLHGRFAEIDFLPEPFAVFQYYKYGLRHPLVSEQRKHVALVLDFGGGTFDVSVVETTKHGDIRLGGANSRPLGAKSIQVGGFHINRILAEQLIFSILPPKTDKSRIRKSLVFFYEHKNAEEDFVSKLSEAESAFFFHMKDVLQNVELAKVAICNSIANWSLAANLSGVAPYTVNVPTDLYARQSARASVRIDANMLFKAYVDDLWPKRLRDTITTTIERAKHDLGGQAISVVLLSGGSSNIRWLRPLLERDLMKHLEHAQVLELNENFQEIVAKGLATECARRSFSDGQGDFRAVTYNRLCLLLRADEGELESKPFRPMVGLPGHGNRDPEPNILLPAASSLRGLVGQKLQWKVKLNKLPKRSLNYYFMRSSFDPEDLDSRHNVVDTRVATPPSTQFHKNIVVELTVRQDGTAEPRFIYGQNDQRTGTVAEGRPFFIDMTFASEEVRGETYLGFDFGTSTSACSYVSSGDVQWVEQRARSADWLELSDMVGDLPYPAATAVARYLSEMDVQRRADRGREAVEALLTLAAWVTLTESSLDERPSTSLFKGLAHRSAGPLWGLLKQLSTVQRMKRPLIASLAPLMKGDSLAQIDTWIGEIANAKHGKASAIDYVSLLTTLSNYVAKMLEHKALGVFENVRAKRFSAGRFVGLFRSLKGPSQTFIDVHEYEGHVSFSEGDVFVVDPQAGTAMCLSPLYLWGLETETSRSVEPDLFEYDTAKREAYSFKSISSGTVVTVSEHGALGEIWNDLSRMKEREQSRQASKDLAFKSERDVS